MSAVPYFLSLGSSSHGVCFSPPQSQQFSSRLSKILVQIHSRFPKTDIPQWPCLLSAHNLKKAKSLLKYFLLYSRFSITGSRVYRQDVCALLLTLGSFCVLSSNEQTTGVCFPYNTHGTAAGLCLLQSDILIMSNISCSDVLSVQITHMINLLPFLHGLNSRHENFSRKEDKKIN